MLSSTDLWGKEHGYACLECNYWLSGFEASAFSPRRWLIVSHHLVTAHCGGGRQSLSPQIYLCATTCAMDPCLLMELETEKKTQ